MSFSVRQKKKERSEIRKNASNKDSSAPLSAYEEHPSPIHMEEAADIENLSPVMEKSDLQHSSTVQQNDTIPSITSKAKDINFIPNLGKKYDPAVIFPYSNKPHETRKKTIAEESKQWESFFDPQHTFGSFQTSIAKPTTSQQQYFYKGKWPLDQEDILGMIPRPKKLTAQQPNNSSATTTPNLSIVEREAIATTTTFAFPAVPSPTLPDRKQLELHINPILQDNESDNLFPKSGSQIEILPCPSLTQFPKYKKSENEVLWRDRLELLNKIQQCGFREELNGTQNSKRMESAATRLHRQLKRKAEKIKRETLMDSSTEEEDDEETDEHNCNDVNAVEDETLLVAMEPDTLVMGSTVKKQEQDTASSLHTHQHESSLVSLNDEWENISFKPPYSIKDVDLEKQEQAPPVEIKRRNRPTFLLFAYGFMFPPLWIIGALYNPSSSLQRTTASKKIDRKWKNYSRNACFVFTIIVAVVVVLILVLKPQVVGFRNSSEQIYQEERVIFDESETIDTLMAAAAATAAGQQLL
ncbi:hypothetical protein [Parasitella parasitica]|uniref:Uncharacterized protein n=1 Tax=Parasitella parasitica TaxID=35722 RepID=A0A0B7N9Q3_9FUNG|nr:hypothetical protein [Parasitella parasitica]